MTVLINLASPTDYIIEKLSKLPFSTGNILIFGRVVNNKSTEDINRIFSAIPQGCDIKIDFSIHFQGTQLCEAIAKLKDKKIHRLSFWGLSTISEEALKSIFLALPSDIHELSLSHRSIFRIPRPFNVPNTPNAFLSFPSHISKLVFDQGMSGDTNEIVRLFSNLPRNLESMEFSLEDKPAGEVVEILRALPRLQSLQIHISNFENYTPEEQGFILSAFPPSLKKVIFHRMLKSEMGFHTALAVGLSQLPEGITTLSFSGHRIGSSLHLDEFLSTIPERFTSLSLSGESAWLACPGKGIVRGLFSMKPNPLLPSSNSRLESIYLSPRTKSEVEALNALPKNLNNLLVDLYFIEFNSSTINEEEFFNALNSRSGKTTFICSNNKQTIKIIENIPLKIKHVIFSNQNQNDASAHYPSENDPIWEIRGDFESLTSMCAHVLNCPATVETVTLNGPAIRRLKPETRERLRVLLKCKFKEVTIDHNEAMRVIPAVKGYLNLSLEPGQGGLNADLLGLSLSYLGNGENFAEMLRNDAEKATSLSLLQDWLKKQKADVKERHAELFKKVEEFCIESEALLKQGKDKSSIYTAAFLTLELLEGNISQEEYKKLLTDHNSYKSMKKWCKIILAIAVLSTLFLLTVNPLLISPVAGELSILGEILYQSILLSFVGWMGLVLSKKVEAIDFRIDEISDELEAHPIATNLFSPA